MTRNEQFRMFLKNTLFAWTMVALPQLWNWKSIFLPRSISLAMLLKMNISSLSLSLSSDLRHCFWLVLHLPARITCVSILFACISNVILFEAAGYQYIIIIIAYRITGISLSFSFICLHPLYLFTSHTPSFTVSHLVRLFNHPKRQSDMNKKNELTISDILCIYAACILHHTHTCYI